jgi:hypothetical protein
MKKACYLLAGFLFFRRYSVSADSNILLIGISDELEYSRSSFASSIGSEVPTRSRLLSMTIAPLLKSIV